MFSPVALTRPTTSPGNASSIVVRSAPNTVEAYLVANGLPVRSQVITMPAIEPARADAGERDAVAVVAVHVGLHLEHERRARLVEVARLAVDVGAGRRRGSEVDDRVEQVADAEVGERRSGEHGRRLAGEERRQVDVGADRVEQVAVVGRLGPLVALLGRRPGGVDVLLGRDLRAAGGAGEAGEHARAAVDHAAEVAVRADRPRRRRRAQADLLLDLVEQLERLHARAGRAC